MPDKVYTVYKITNQVNSKIYIGYTKFTAEERWKEHVGNRNVKNYHLSCAIRKYGADSFDVETLWQSRSSEAAKETEKLLIAEYKSHLRDVGYNLTMGGEGQSSTPEVKKKIAASLIGKKRSRETRELQSSLKKGLVYQEENLRLMLELKEKGLSYPEISRHFSSIGIKAKSGKDIAVSVFHGAFKKLLAREVIVEGYSIERLKHIEEISLKAAEKKVEENWKNKERISSTRVSKIYEKNNLNKIYQMRKAGRTLKQIAEWANEEGILNTHGKRFSHVAFSFIFKKIENGLLAL